MVLLNSNSQIFVIVFVNLVCAEMTSKEIKEHAKKSFVSLLKNIIDVNEKRIASMKRLNNLQDFITTRDTLAKMHDLDMGVDDSSEDFKSENEILTLLDRRNNLDLTLRTYKNKKKGENNNINIIIPFNSFNVKTMSTYNENNKLNNIDDYNGRHNNYDGKMYGKNYINNEIENINNEDIDKVIDVVEYESKKQLNSNGNSYERSTDTEIYINNNNGEITNNINENIKSENSNETYESIVDDSSVNRRSWKSHSCDKRAAKVCRKACVEAHKNGCMLYKCSRRAKKAFSKECKRSCRAMFIRGRYSDSDFEIE